MGTSQWFVIFNDSYLYGPFDSNRAARKWCEEEFEPGAKVVITTADSPYSEPEATE